MAAWVVGIAVVAVAALTGGTILAWNLLSGSDAATTTTEPAASSTPETTSPAPSRSPRASASPTPSPTASSTTVPVVPAAAFPGAGGEAPSGATPISAIHISGTSEIATIQTPSGNIGCDFIKDEAGQTSVGCGVTSYAETGQYGQDEGGRKWWIDLTGPDAPTIYSKGDVAYYMTPEAVPQVVAYGTVVTYGDYVCGSAEGGLTCWNAVTGHGVFMNRAGYEAF